MPVYLYHYTSQPPSFLSQIPTLPFTRALSRNQGENTYLVLVRRRLLRLTEFLLEGVIDGALGIRGQVLWGVWR